MQRSTIKFGGEIYESTGETASGDFGLVTFYQNKINNNNNNNNKKMVVKTPINAEAFDLSEWQKEEECWNVAYPQNPCQLIRQGKTCELYLPFLGEQTLTDLMVNITDPEPFLQIYIAVIEALKQLHEKGIVHQDVKDANIRITKTSTAYLIHFIDFGKAEKAKNGDAFSYDVDGLLAMLNYHDAIKNNAVCSVLPFLNRIVLEGIEQVPIERMLDVLRSVCQFELAQLTPNKDVRSALSLVQQVLITPDLQKLHPELYKTASMYKIQLLADPMLATSVTNQSFLNQENSSLQPSNNNNNNNNAQPDFRYNYP